ncbi:MAG: zinc ribbon domain-containing protein [Candidatus Omnitrophica bacterium]|nr:zinc ribbon domain-containing protein [Candidatus Omnitrophota bacterium]
MPTYEYECLHCKHAFELFQKINDQPAEKCPKCGKKVKRLIGSGSGIIFKGPGFYATDYRKPTKANPANTCPKAKEGCDGCKHSK